MWECVWTRGSRVEEVEEVVGLEGPAAAEEEEVEVLASLVGGSVIEEDIVRVEESRLSRLISPSIAGWFWVWNALYVWYASSSPLSIHQLIFRNPLGPPPCPVRE